LTQRLIGGGGRPARALGPGRLDEEGKRIPPELKKGDRVLFPKYSGTEIDIDDHKYLIMKESDVLATL
jgi:chaperonin GroES